VFVQVQVQVQVLVHVKQVKQVKHVKQVKQEKQVQVQRCSGPFPLSARQNLEIFKALHRCTELTNVTQQ